MTDQYVAIVMAPNSRWFHYNDDDGIDLTNE